MKKILFAVSLICLSSLSNFAFAEEFNDLGLMSQESETLTKKCVCYCFKITEDDGVTDEKLTSTVTKLNLFVVDEATTEKECDNINDETCKGTDSSGKGANGTLNECEMSYL